MARTSIAFLVLVALLPLTASGQDKSGDVTLRVAKYDVLKDEILKNRGKVVLIDLWGDFCTPCKKAFPHTVELSRKFGDKGLAVISVALDETEKKDAVLRFLKKQNATFTNILLDEPIEFWQKKFRTDAVPCMYVFSRQGKWTQLTGEDLEGTQKLDRLIEELIAEK